MTRFTVLAPRERAAATDLSRDITAPTCLVACEITVREQGGRAVDHLPRDPDCLYVEMERGHVYRADPSGIVYKGDLLTMLGLSHLAQALEGTTYVAVTVRTASRLSASRAIAQALGTTEVRILAALMAGGLFELSRKDLVAILVATLTLASDQTSEILAREGTLGDDAHNAFGAILDTIELASQALCA